MISLHSHPTHTGVPAKAGAHFSAGSGSDGWVPAFAGTTDQNTQAMRISPEGLAEAGEDLLGVEL